MEETEEKTEEVNYKELLFKGCREKDLNALDKLYEEVGGIEVMTEEFIEFCLDGNMFAIDQILLRFDIDVRHYLKLLETPVKPGIEEESFREYMKWCFDANILDKSVTGQVIKHSTRNIELCDKFRMDNEIGNLIMLFSNFRVGDAIKDDMMLYPRVVERLVSHGWDDKNFFMRKYNINALIKICENEEIKFDKYSIRRILTLLSKHDIGLFSKLFHKYYHLIEFPHSFMEERIANRIDDVSILQEYKSIFTLDIFPMIWKCYYFYFTSSLPDNRKNVLFFLNCLSDSPNLKEVLQVFYKILDKSQRPGAKDYLNTMIMLYPQYFPEINIEEILTPLQINEYLDREVPVDLAPEMVNRMFKKIILKLGTQADHQPQLTRIGSLYFDKLTPELRLQILLRQDINAWNKFAKKIFLHQPLQDYIIVKMFYLCQFVKIQQANPNFLIETDKEIILYVANTIFINRDSSTEDKLYIILRDFTQFKRTSDEEQCFICHSTKSEHLVLTVCKHVICVKCIVKQYNLAHQFSCAICRRDIVLTSSKDFASLRQTWMNKFPLVA